MATRWAVFSLGMVRHVAPTVFDRGREDWVLSPSHWCSLDCCCKPRIEDTARGGIIVHNDLSREA